MEIYRDLKVHARKVPAVLGLMASERFEIELCSEDFEILTVYMLVYFRDSLFYNSLLEMRTCFKNYKIYEDKV